MDTGAPAYKISTPCMVPHPTALSSPTMSAQTNAAELNKLKKSELIERCIGLAELTTKLRDENNQLEGCIGYLISEKELLEQKNGQFLLQHHPPPDGLMTNNKQRGSSCSMTKRAHQLRRGFPYQNQWARWTGTINSMKQ